MILRAPAAKKAIFRSPPLSERRRIETRGPKISDRRARTRPPQSSGLLPQRNKVGGIADELKRYGAIQVVRDKGRAAVHVDAYEGARVRKCQAHLSAAHADAVLPAVRS
jgi:hypothetical protein